MLISPAETRLGGEIDLDVQVGDPSGHPATILWEADGGKVVRPNSKHASYTCRVPGYYRVQLTISNAWCRTEQESHVICRE
jgi:PKD repeat protein